MFTVIFSIYQFNIKADSKGEYRITNIRIYQNTPAWKLALAVKGQRTDSIAKILKEKPNLLNYQEPKYGVTLLLWAIGMGKYRSAKALLKCGADPNIASTFDGETPLFAAAGWGWKVGFFKKNTKYVKLLLRYGANPNINYIGSDVPGNRTVIEPGTSPLMESITGGIEKTKALVKAGADINYKTPKTKSTAAWKALLNKEYPEYAYYLIVEKKAKVTEPTYKRHSYGKEDPNENFFPVDILRDWVFDLNSKEYKIKKEIIAEFARQGVNYWDTKIPKFTLEHIKKLYPKTWEEYIKRY
jgi:ankyrin repeat protein